MNIIPKFLRKEKPKRTHPRMYRKYAAAKIDNLTAGWGVSVSSADAILRSDLKSLRARSRILSENDPYFKNFLRKCRVNVIGNSGIVLQNRAVENVTKDGETILDDNANRIIEDAWNQWCKKKNCTVNGKLSFIDVQQLFIESVAKDGEVLIRKVKGSHNEFGFALQLIEADHLSENHNEDLPNGNIVRMGIEINKWNRPVAYYIHERHPGEHALGSRKKDEVIRIPAEEIIHAYIPERISQSRGVPWAHAAMTRSNMLNGYQEAELVAARIGASKMGFFVSPDGEAYVGQDQEDNGDIITEADPGTFEQLPEGVDFREFSPDHPTSAFEPFVKSILRGMSAGMGVSYNSLANDLEGVNFSSLRQGNIEERDLWKILQRWTIENLHEQIFEDWLLMSITTGKISLPVSKFEKFNKPIWRPRGWMWVDPVKEVRSNRDAIDGGLKSAQDVASEQGMDIEDVYIQLAVEKKLREKYGVSLMDEIVEEANDEEEEE